MKKFIACLLVFFSFVVWTDPFAQRKLSWNKKIVENCIRSTTIVIVDVKDYEYLGTGIMIKPDGTTLTAAHVVSHLKTQRLLIISSIGTIYPAEVLLSDKLIDLALIRPIKSAQKFRFVKIQKSNKLNIGQDILVIGHPESIFYTVTSGIISKIYYTIWYAGQVIDITAIIGPGSSGGPIFNTYGELIGIVSAMHISSDRQPTGIGLGISVKSIHHFLKKYEAMKVFNRPIKTHTIGELE